MKKTEFYILNALYNGSIGKARCTYDISERKSICDQNSINSLIIDGLISKDGSQITNLGIKALNPYMVDNAVILAAGASTRFIPLSLEQPKGLYEVKGDHFFDGDKMICPFDRSKDELFEAKHQCMLHNSVIFIRNNEIEKIKNNINIF